MGAMPRASAVTAAIVKAFAIALRFMVIFFAFINLLQFRKEIIPTACSPSTATGGSRRQKRPRFGIFFASCGDLGWSIDASCTEITGLLKAWNSGDQAALAQLAERVYPELRLMARRYMKNERHANTLQATALIHEVYLRLIL